MLNRITQDKNHIRIVKMPGGGSIQGMITSLGNNKKLLKSKRLFKRERTFLNAKKDIGLNYYYYTFEDN
ncbi:hypothetical protein [Mangrovimonas spongiae]|uniref:Uncharacterized protein n=1 Tax=Mangrovimonas spongiae TaxID=2494697 RepID=A0A428JX08_9FLAO|nr:hypothetical protein [Mangrovimonas spongiae]RSK38624.1 hypothetical protein EJA19_11235 [Mangrovimonas spongiae]